MDGQKIIYRNPILEYEIKFMLSNGMITGDEANFLYRYCRWQIL